MLVLTRRLREEIQIGDDVTITILRVIGRTVRVGIEAPRDVRIVRGELHSPVADEIAATSVTRDAEGVTVESGASPFERPAPAHADDKDEDAQPPRPLLEYRRKDCPLKVSQTASRRNVLRSRLPRPGGVTCVHAGEM